MDEEMRQRFLDVRKKAHEVLAEMQELLEETPWEGAAYVLMRDDAITREVMEFLFQRYPFIDAHKNDILGGWKTIAQIENKSIKNKGWVCVTEMSKIYGGRLCIRFEPTMIQQLTERIKRF